MNRYAVERYVPGANGIEPVRTQDRLVATRVSAAAIGIRYLGAIYMPADEICFSLFEGPSIEAVRQANDAAGSSYVRIVEALDLREEG